jgi:sentrin-specific protease 1
LKQRNEKTKTNTRIMPAYRYQKYNDWVAAFEAQNGYPVPRCEPGKRRKRHGDPPYPCLPITAKKPRPPRTDSQRQNVPSRKRRPRGPPKQPRQFRQPRKMTMKQWRSKYKYIPRCPVGFRRQRSFPFKCRNMYGPGWRSDYQPSTPPSIDSDLRLPSSGEIQMYADDRPNPIISDLSLPPEGSPLPYGLDPAGANFADELDNDFVDDGAFNQYEASPVASPVASPIALPQYPSPSPPPPQPPTGKAADPIEISSTDPTDNANQQPNLRTNAAQPGLFQFAPTLVEAEAQIDEHFNNPQKRPGNALLYTMVGNFEITQASFERLKDRQWLDDEIINGFCAMINRKNNFQGYNNCYIFLTFFMSNLVLTNEKGYDYSQVSRWTKKTNIFTKNLILIPVNLSNNHWALICVDMLGQKIYYYDSLASMRWGRKLTKWTERYLGDEWVKVGGDPNRIPRWEKFSVPGPQQENGDDCGVFMLYNIYCLVGGEAAPGGEMYYDQNDIPGFRRFIATSIVMNKVRFVGSGSSA